MRIKITLALTCLIKIWSFARSFTYNALSQDWKFTTTNFLYPGFILSFESSNKILLVNTQNTFTVLELSSTGVIASLFSSPFLHYHPSSNSNSKMGFEVSGTNYFLLGTEPQGRGISRIDFTDSIGYIDINFGSSSLTESVQLLLKMSETVFVSGNPLVVREISTGMKLMASTGSFTNKIIRGPLASSMEFISMNKLTKLITKMKIDRSNGVGITSIEDFSLFNGVSVHEIACLHTFSIFIACDSLNCKGLDYSTQSILWTSPLSSWGTSSVIIKAVQATNFFFLGTKGGEKIGYVQQVQFRNASSVRASQTGLMTDAISASNPVNGGFIAVLTTKNVVIMGKSSDCLQPCKTCSFDNDSFCLTCEDGFYSGNSLCLTCHSSCDLCSGSGELACTKCQTGFTWNETSLKCQNLTSSGPITIPPTDNNNSVSSPAQNCRELMMGFQQDRNNCIECFNHTIYLSETNTCTSQPICYLEWTAKLSWKSYKTILLVEFDVVPNDNCSMSYDKTTQSITQKESLNLLRFSFDIRVTGIKPELISRTSILLHLDRELKSTEMKIDLAIDNLRVGKENNLMWNSSQGMGALVGNSINIRIPKPSSQEEQISESIKKFGSLLTSISKVSIGAAVGLAIFGTACSLNFGPAFMKIFQIIEVLGKFYFLPVYFSPVMDYFLQNIHDLSDLIVLRKDFFINEQKTQPNPFENKLTKLQQDRFILRSNPLQVIIFIFVLAVVLFLTLIGKRCKYFSNKTIQIVTSIKNMIFHMKYIDFFFDSSFSLTGMWKVSSYDFPFFMNQAFAIILMVDCCRKYVEIAGIGVGGRIKSGNDKVKQRDSYSVVVEGIKPGLFDNYRVRMVNVFSLAKLHLHQVILATTQNTPGFSVFLLLTVEFLFFGYFIYCWFEYEPFESLHAMVQKVSFELCTTLFSITIMLRAIGSYHIYIDYFTILVTLGVVLIQFISAMKSLIQVLSELCFKSKKTYLKKRMVIEKAKETISNEENRGNIPAKKIKIVSFQPGKRKVLLVKESNASPINTSFQASDNISRESPPTLSPKKKQSRFSVGLKSAFKKSFNSKPRTKGPAKL